MVGMMDFSQQILPHTGRQPILAMATFAIVSALFLAVLCNFGSNTSLIVTEPLVYTNNAKGAAKRLFEFDDKEKQRNVHTMAVYRLKMGGLHPSSILNIRPNGCVERIRFNNKPLDISHISYRERCDTTSYFELHAPTNSSLSSNYMVVQISNPLQSDPKLYQYNPLYRGLLIAAFVLFLLAGLYFTLRRQYALAFLQLCVLALGSYCWYLFNSSIFHSGVNVKDHLYYINVIDQYGTLPNPTQSWQGHHPPLYYYLAAMLRRMAAWWGMTHPINALRMLSVLFYAMFLGYGLFALWRLYPLSKLSSFIGSLLLLFWPLGIMAASWVDSNVLWWALGAACYVHTVLWSRSYQHKHLIIALMYMALAIITLSNAYILLLFVWMTYIVLVWHDKIHIDYFIQRTILLCLVLVIAAIGINSYRSLELHREGVEVDMLVGKQRHETKNAQLQVGNEIKHYLAFDLVSHVRAPYLNPLAPDSGRENFWSTTLKSSLFSEVHLQHAKAAMLLNYLLLGLCALLIFPTLWYRRSHVTELWTAWLYSALSIAALMFLRSYMPVVSSSHFRHVYPLLIPAIVLICAHLDIIKERRNWPLFILGYALCISFPLVSIFAIMYEVL